jgi:hypothetical protein
MKAFQWLLLLPILLMQVWPVGMGLAAEPHLASCEMDCCAWLVEAGLAEDCVCAESPNAPLRPIPGLPNDVAGAGKSLQPGWVVADDRFHPSGAGAADRVVRIYVETEDTEVRPHVRLTVLFGTFLI